MLKKHLKKMMFCFLGLVFLLPHEGISQKKIKPRKLKKDLNVLLEAVEKHPNLYEILSKDSFDNKVAFIKNEIEQPKTVDEFYKLTASLLALFNDSYTSIHFPKGWRQKHWSQYGFFPFKVHLSDENRLYLLNHFLGENTIALTSELLSINGLNIDSFIKQIEKWIPFENLSVRNQLIERGMNLWITLHFGLQKTHTIKLADFDRDFIVNNITPEDLENYQHPENEELRRLKKIRDGEPYEYKKLDDQIGLLSIYSFWTPKGEEHKTFLKETFRKINRDSVQSLILDIRGYTYGYLSNTPLLVHYLTDRPFKTNIGYRLNKKYTNSLRKISRTGMGLNFNKDPEFINAYLDSLYASTLQEPIHLENEFSGDLFLLTDQDMNSNTVAFSSIIKCSAGGLVIGAVANSTPSYYTIPIKGELKHSKLSYQISTVEYFTSCAGLESEGVKPDITFKPSIFEMSKGVDSQLNFAKLAIKKINKRKQAVSNSYNEH